MTLNCITDIPGIRVGHAQDWEGLTGCTVILADRPAVGGVDQRGGAPGTRETDLLRPMHLVQEVHAILLSGGSAFGLNAATGVMQYLEERHIGFDVGVGKVPIVPGAVIFDLGIGNPAARPDAAMGYAACLNATSTHPGEGCLGAGTGATAGKINGMACATKTGLGTASIAVGSNLRVAALIVANPFGDILDFRNGQILAGVRKTPAKHSKNDPHEKFEATIEILKKQAQTNTRTSLHAGNTVIGVIATNALLTKEEANKVAQMAQDGIARTISPAHTMLDGDTLFCLATGEIRADVNLIGALAADVTAQAIIRAAITATPAGGLPAFESNS